MDYQNIIRENLRLLGYEGDILEKMTRRISNQSADFLSRDGRSISPDVFDFKAKAEHLVELLNVPLENILKAAKIQPTLLIRNPETININLDEIQKITKVPKRALALLILARAPDILSKTGDHIRKNIIDCAKIMDLSEDAYIAIMKRHIGNLGVSGESLKRKIEEGSVALGISEKEFKRAITKDSSILGLSAEKLQLFAEENAKFLGVSKRDFVKAVIKQKQQQIFIRSPETIARNVRGSAKLLGVSENVFKAAALKRVTLLATLPLRVRHNAKRTADLLGIERQYYFDQALKKAPALLTLSPSDINGKAEKLAEKLNLSKPETMELAIKEPQILYQDPDTIHARVQRGSELLGISEAQYVMMAKKHPPILYRDPEVVAKNAALMQLFHTKGILSENPENFYLGKPDVLCLKSDNFYLRYIFAKESNMKNVKGFGLLRQPRKDIEGRLARLFDKDPDEKIITRPRVKGVDVSPEEKRHRAFVGLVQRGIVSGFKYKPQ